MSLRFIAFSRQINCLRTPWVCQVHNSAFAILCDTERRVVRDWDIFNARERGGIAKPSVFLIDRDCTVRYASLDGIASRVPASELVRLLQTVAEARPARRKLYIPTPGDWVRAIRNSFRRKP
jgi:alkyl hydroperoxide reductase subunit AhpC